VKGGAARLAVCSVNLKRELRGHFFSIRVCENADNKKAEKTLSHSFCFVNAVGSGGADQSYAIRIQERC